MKFRHFLSFILLFSSSLTAGPFSYFFDSVDRGDLEKVMTILEKMKPKVEPLPYYRTATRGLVKAMEWRFRQEISEEQAREKAINEINLATLPDEEKENMVAIIEYLSEERPTLLQKGKNLFRKKKELPPFKIEGVEIYFGALLTQVTWVPASNFGDKMIADGMRRLQRDRLACAFN